MATLSVLKVNDPYGADRVLIALQGMQERQLITLQDAAVVSWPQGNRKPKTRELHGGSAGWGAFWGFLIGLIFFVPFLGAAIGGISGAMSDVGIDDDSPRGAGKATARGLRPRVVRELDCCGAAARIAASHRIGSGASQ